MSDDRLLRYIASLTSEERERYRPLIEDALRLDRQLSVVMQEARERLESHAESLQRLKETTRKFNESLWALNGKLDELAEASGMTAECAETGFVRIARPGGSTLIH